MIRLIRYVLISIFISFSYKETGLLTVFLLLVIFMVLEVHASILIEPNKRAKSSVRNNDEV